MTPPDGSEAAAEIRPLPEDPTVVLGPRETSLRTGAPIVPVVLGGTHLLFRGRTIVVRILAPVTASLRP